MSSKSKVITGSILILAGASSLVQNFGIINENFVLPILGAAFLIVYFVLGGRKRYGNIGFLIPGVILPAMQVLKLADDYHASERTEIILVFGMLSACFLAIYLIHSFWFKEFSRGKRSWPLYVSLSLILFGVIVYAAEYYNWSFGVILLGNTWPIILVLVGIRLLYKALKIDKQNLNK
jgi:hypothetical protein